MPKKPRNLETIMDSQQVKGSERILKSARQYLGHICWLFVNILTPDEKYSLSVNTSV